MMNNIGQFLNLAMSNNKYMQNPIFRNAVSMYKSNNSKGLEELARNLCKERGMSPEDVLRQMNVR